MTAIEQISASAARTLAKALARELRGTTLTVQLQQPAPPATAPPAAEPQPPYGRLAREAEEGVESAYLDGDGRLRWVPVDGDPPPARWLPLYELLDTGQ